MYASSRESIIVFMDLQLICEPAQLPWQSIIGHVVGFTNSARQRANSPSAGKELVNIGLAGSWNTALQAGGIQQFV